jgi:predicted TIM-barrel fold metal-dependent hydrolase
MIVDSITHVTSDGKWFHTEHNASEARLMDEMDKAGVDKAVVVGLAGHITNEYVLEVCQRWEKRLIPCGSFNPVSYDSPQDAANTFRRTFINAPFPFIKLHPRLNGYSLQDPRLLAILDVAAELMCFRAVYLDSLIYNPAVSTEKHPVDALREIAVRNPQLTFVFLHGAGTNLLHLFEAVKQCANVIIDISFTMHYYAGSSLENDIRYLLRRFDRRLVMGSDFPEYTPVETLSAFDRLSDGLPEEKRHNILGRNLASLLKGLAWEVDM